MKYQIIGCEHVKGTGKDRETGREFSYDFYRLHEVHNLMTVAGSATGHIKVKATEEGAVCEAVGVKSVADLVGHVIEADVSRYEKLLNIELVK